MRTTLNGGGRFVLVVTLLNDAYQVINYRYRRWPYFGFGGFALDFIFIAKLFQHKGMV